MRQAGRFAVVVLVGAALFAAGAWWKGVTWSDLRHWGTPRNAIEIDGQTIRIPVAQGPDQRVLPEVEVDTVGAYDLLFRDGGPDGGPVRYDPCRPLEYVIAEEGLPDGFVPTVQAAVASVSQATGLAFVYEGLTDEEVDFDRALVQERYGNRFAPIVIGFQTEDQNPDLAGTVTGLGGSSAVPGAYGDAQYLRSGVVIIDSEDVARILEDPDGEALAQAVVAHELGHVVGLAHVGDTHELMHESNLRLLDWGPGDLAGLALAGAGECEPR
ncbi:matrixin family metalloprotease [Demequina subtropica]|uniref:matrixin family metalloprotease n=1 Tax=Demequina subtropica TaxID=1638989 RepID=UPI000780FC11|nr:matrixin family metalloprotease [Demequina subtropica]